ncbi:MAG TPA: hypothetical protein VIH56_06785 [Candidatus Acidoferrales bacterium]
MSRLFELMHHALNLAETAKDAMRSNSIGEPDEVTWGTAVTVLNEAQQLLPENPILKDLKLSSKRWVSMRSAMEAVANSLSSANSDANWAGLAARNKRAIESLRNGY